MRGAVKRAVVGDEQTGFRVCAVRLVTSRLKDMQDLEVRSVGPNLKDSSSGMVRRTRKTVLRGAVQEAIRSLNEAIWRDAVGRGLSCR